MIIDLHCHPNLKSFNSGFPNPKANMWEKIEHVIENKFAKSINDLTLNISKESQCNLDNMVR
ncbi:MAG: hypothetical protein IPJ22_12685 [Bacteroidetes bacterium]|nr:hypothetical protein [Bacteroidota bacterium]